VGKSDEKDEKQGYGERIAAFIDVVDMDRKDFAEKIDIPYSRLQSYIQEKAETSHEFWEKVKQNFPQADISYLMLGIEEMPKGGFATPEQTHVPIVSTIGAGSLSFGFADEDIIEWIWTSLVKDKDVFGLKVKGNSMFPQILEGDYVLCAPARQFINGKIYAVVCGDSEHTVKIVYKEKGGYRLVPNNPEYESVFVPEEEMIKLVRVVQVISLTD
jgi:SOS-response transcriptional repressor LexA